MTKLSQLESSTIESRNPYFLLASEVKTRSWPKEKRKKKKLWKGITVIDYYNCFFFFRTASVYLEFRELEFGGESRCLSLSSLLSLKVWKFQKHTQPVAHENLVNPFLSH